MTRTQEKIILVKMIPIKATRTAAHQETTIITTEVHLVIMTRTITVKTITTPIITAIVKCQVSIFG